MAFSTPSVSFVATSDKVWIRFLINGPSSVVSPAYFWDIQLEPGTVSPYEPYKLAGRPAPKIPKKNLIRGEKEQNNSLFNIGSSGVDNRWENGKLLVFNGHASVHGKGVWIDVEPGKPYTVSFEGENAIDGVMPRLRIGYNSTSGTEIQNSRTVYPFTFTPMQSPISIRFGRDSTTDTGDKPIKVWNIQLEPGSAKTPYEPYTPVLRKARR
jgi:hypothetical protein